MIRLIVPAGRRKHSILQCCFRLGHGPARPLIGHLRPRAFPSLAGACGHALISQLELPHQFHIRCPPTSIRAAADPPLPFRSSLLPDLPVHQPLQNIPDSAPLPHLTFPSYSLSCKHNNHPKGHPIPLKQSQWLLPGRSIPRLRALPPKPPRLLLLTAPTR